MPLIGHRVLTLRSCSSLKLAGGISAPVREAPRSVLAAAKKQPGANRFGSQILPQRTMDNTVSGVVAWSLPGDTQAASRGIVQRLSIINLRSELSSCRISDYFKW